MIRIDFQGVSTDALAASEQIRAASDCFTRHGYAILDHVIPQDIVHALHDEFNDRYREYIADRESEDSLQVGNKRFMIPLHFSGNLGAPLVFANPYVIALVREVLDRTAVLEAFGAIISLSGAEAQFPHPDGPPLFGDGLSPLLPAHALTFALPLVEMNEVSGTTALWAGSHRWKSFDDTAVPERPVIPVGSCALWDFRLLHSGAPNRSDRPRPMVYATYARPWYQDPVNFIKAAQQRLVFEPTFLQSLAEDVRPLFSHVREALLPGERLRG
jgi:ectoine hydroxylase-related dioxygenase (phytanoyl-CoA dioxygenase family)